MQKIRDIGIADPGWVVDYQANAAYLNLSQAAIYETINYGVINVDVDKDGNAVGIELLTLTPGDT